MKYLMKKVGKKVSKTYIGKDFAGGIIYPSVTKKKKPKDISGFYKLSLE